MIRQSREKLAKKRSIKGYAKQAESNKLLKQFILPQEIKTTFLKV